MIDASGVLARVDIVDVIGARVQLRRAGAEWSGLCPFHDERTPSFTVSASKQFFHCFGCGAHGDAIEFVMKADGIGFVEACEQLGGGHVSTAPVATPIPRRKLEAVPNWVPLMPVPEDAPPLVRKGARYVELWNPKRGRVWRCEPERVDAYRDAEGQLLGYVLRVAFDDGQKVTPQVTYCVGPDGARHWCARSFPSPRPLQGLDALAAKAQAPVIVVEGEKCREVAAGAFPHSAVITWPGGSKGMRHVDWSPLAKRSPVLLWPDADEGGRAAMLGWRRGDGLLVDGVAQIVWRMNRGAQIRVVDTAGLERGWDVADALQRDGWTVAQLRQWVMARLIEVQCEYRAECPAA